MTSLERSLVVRREHLRRQLAGASIVILTAVPDQLRELADEVGDVADLISNLADVADQAEAESGQVRSR